MFSSHRLDASQGLRQEKLQKLHDYVNDCCSNEQVVDIGDAVFITSLNLMSATLFSTDFAQFNSKSSQETKEVVRGLMTVGAVPNLADFFPVLKFIDPQGLLRETKSYLRKVFVIFDDLINQRLKSRGESLDHSVKSDLLEAILNHNQTNQTELTFDVLKHLLLDLFIAGTDTTSSTKKSSLNSGGGHDDSSSYIRNKGKGTAESSGSFIPKLTKLDLPRYNELEDPTGWICRAARRTKCLWQGIIRKEMFNYGTNDLGKGSEPINSL
ncbi:unnamed protein product [Fraxinus pennsylvanica]|uniref:Cytochrome P450 n=1 Tax=Fraxinus pennsylvanica TaxID=56036 RepID=A0AAD2DXE2_9LAMI|nr:unnamed protein product [Fraxinus pennsylvanica]